MTSMIAGEMGQVQPEAIFFEQDTGFMLHGGAWWVQLGGHWFRVYNDEMVKMLTRRWAHLHMDRNRREK